MKTTIQFSVKILIHYMIVASVLIFSGCKDKEEDPAPAPTTTSNTVALKTVAISGEYEAPASGSSATGTFTGTYDMDTKILSYTITYTGVTPTAMHFHNGYPGINGGVEFTLTTPSSSPASGSTAALTAQQQTDLLAGKFYLNIHSAAYPSGDIRAQVLTSNHEVIWADLSGDNEVPASGSAVTGSLIGLYDKSTKVLNYALEYSGGTPNAMHIHDGEAGTNGGVALTLTTPASSPAIGTTAAFTTSQETNLLAGKMYLNIHSAAYAAGEIRGQLVTDNIIVMNTIIMDGNNEVPASGSTATGIFYGTYNKTTKVLSYNFTYTGVTPTAAHFHNGAIGVNGGVEFTLTTPASSPASGSTAAFTAAQETSLLGGDLYINIHSAAYPSGDIRGQLVP